MAEERDVVITGLGVVTPLGCDIDSFWSSLTAGRSGVGPISTFDASSYPSRIAGEVREFIPHPDLSAELIARLDRSSQFAASAALQALADSRLLLTPDTAPFVGLALGSARPGETTVWEAHRAFHERGGDAISAGYIARTLPDASATQTAAALGVRGPVLGVSAGGASGAVALARAARMVRHGEVQVAIAGGADAPITPLALAAFCAMNVLTKRNDEPARACRPFDAQADGFVLSEGAAVLVLEDEALARQRDAHIYARLAGAGSVTEPGAAVPSHEDAGRAMQAALREPALLQGEIDYFCTYAPGMAELDKMETAAIKRIFGELTASKLTLSAPKSMLGHLLGASGAVDAVICAKAIETGMIPPTINLDSPAEGCDLDYTPNEARRATVRHAMSYAYGFGGHHLALCFSAP